MNKLDSKIGFIGLGLMGTPMTLRLLDAGFDIHVWNRSSAKLASVVDAGATPENYISELIASCDIIMLCLSNTEAVEEVVFGEGGVATQGSTGKLLIDFSSIDPVETKRFAIKLENICGMRWVDAPASGGVAGAISGD